MKELRINYFGKTYKLSNYDIDKISLTKKEDF